MDKLDIYEYDKRNRNDLVEAISKVDGEIVSWSFFAKEDKNFEFPKGTKQIYIDISSLCYNDNRIDTLISIVEIIINSILYNTQPMEIFLITERQFSQMMKDVLYFKIGEIYRLEDKLLIDNDPVKNIVDIKQSDFINVIDYLNQNLFGNDLFKIRLNEELTKFRLFNKLKYQPIFQYCFVDHLE